MKRPQRPTLDEFETAYVEAALWASTCDQMVKTTAHPNGELHRDAPMDHRYGIEHVERDTLIAMKTECHIFRHMAGALLEKAATLGDYAKRDEWTPEMRCGHDFWLSRNGHGAGFFDRELVTADGENVGDQLQKLAESFGEAHLWVSKGRVYMEQG